MWALALKDISLVGRRAWILVAMSFFLMFYWTNPLIGLAFSLFPSMYAISWTSGLDFRYKADSLVACLPFVPAKVVAARFLVVLLAWAAGFAAGLVPWAVRSAFGAFIPAAQLPGIAAISLSLALVANSVYLAAYYVFGFQNARWANFVFFGAIGALGPIMNKVSSVPASAASSSAVEIIAGLASAPLYAAAFAVALAFAAACLAASLAAYRRKEF